MNWSTERVELSLTDPFRISREPTGTAEAENVVVRLERDGTTGVGAAAPSSHYGETVDTVEAVLPDLFDAVSGVDPHRRAEVERRLRRRVEGNPAARTAVSVAVHDWVCRDLGVPLYRLWGLSPDRAPATSYTVGLADPDEMVEKAERAVEAGHSILKVKLDADRDHAVVGRIRDALPEVGIRVDANGAWRPKEAVDNCRALAEYGVEFVEQPVDGEDVRGLGEVHRRSPVPVAVDEPVETAADVVRFADRADVVVVKLMKCGGLPAARRAIATAHAHDLEVMVGCMIETGAAIAASAHLAPAVEYADLDGSLLLAADPYDDPVADDGRIDLGSDPGTGARER